MQSFFLLFLFVVFSLSVSAQNEQPVSVDSTGIDELYLAKDNAGKAGEPVESFSTGDVPIHCVVQLDSEKIVTVKMNFVAEKVSGVKAETKVISVVYKTDGKQNQVNFTGKPEGRWVAGSYRIDIYIDDRAAASRRFEIRKMPGEPENASQQNIKNFVPAKSKPPRRAKKN